MKRITKLFTSLAVALSLFVAPAAVMAQSADIPTVEVGTADTSSTSSTDTSTTSTTSTTAGVPQTGIAPQPSALARNLAVFAVGGTVGALMGLGIVAYKKQIRSQK